MNIDIIITNISVRLYCKTALLFLFVTVLVSSCTERKSKKTLAEETALIELSVSNKVSALIKGIRDNKISEIKARKELFTLLNLIKQMSVNHQNILLSSDKITFPVKGYTPQESIGGNTDEGYIPGKYNFYDGNAHKGHPALDIFIHDYNQDCLDDITGNPVQILSMTGGVVLSAEPNWDTTSTLRGGKYIWIFDPIRDYIFYYAHNDNILIKTGQIVKAGDVLGTCGRTGLNAYKKRSPTHLHIMILDIANKQNPVPLNPYPLLGKSIVK